MKPRCSANLTTLPLKAKCSPVRTVSITLPHESKSAWVKAKKKKVHRSEVAGCHLSEIQAEWFNKGVGGGRWGGVVLANQK